MSASTRRRGARAGRPARLRPPRTNEHRVRRDVRLQRGAEARARAPSPDARPRVRRRGSERRRRSRASDGARSRARPSTAACARPAAPPSCGGASRWRRRRRGAGRTPLDVAARSPAAEPRTALRAAARRRVRSDDRWRRGAAVGLRRRPSHRSAGAPRRRGERGAGPRGCGHARRAAARARAAQLSPRSECDGGSSSGGSRWSCRGAARGCAPSRRHDAAAHGAARRVRRRAAAPLACRATRRARPGPPARAPRRAGAAWRGPTGPRPDKADAPRGRARRQSCAPRPRPGARSPAAPAPRWLAAAPSPAGFADEAAAARDGDAAARVDARCASSRRCGRRSADGLSCDCSDGRCSRPACQRVRDAAAPCRHRLPRRRRDAPREWGPTSRLGATGRSPASRSPRAASRPPRHRVHLALSVARPRDRGGRWP